MSPQSATALQPVKGPAQTSIFNRMEELHHAIARRAFEIFEGKGRWPGRELDDWLRAESELLHPMHLELMVSDNHVIVRAEAPRFSAKELEVHVEPRRLTISVKRETKDEAKKRNTVYFDWCAREALPVVDLR